MRKPTAIDIAISAAVLILILCALAPALGRAQRSAAETKCQSNLQRWAEAMELYVADNDSRYPTNRYKGTALMSTLLLSQNVPIPPATEPPTFQYGPNWVEALYPYVKKSAHRTDQDWKSMRRCPNATDNLYPPRPTTGMDLNWAMTYVMNGSLVEYNSTTARNPHKLMMIRELGRLTISTLRPTNRDCVGNPSVKPIDPFLHDRDTGIGNTSAECKLHGDGSYVLFADGHVHYFDVSYYPDYSQISAAMSFDEETMQWWNFVGRPSPDYSVDAAHSKSIAITP